MKTIITNKYRMMIEQIIIIAKRRLIEISDKNKDKTEYSLGDVLLLDKYEKILKDNGYTQEQIEGYSESYYITKQ